MPNTREKLIELFFNAEQMIHIPYGMDTKQSERYVFEQMAEHLISNGVTVLPCKIGDVVWGIKKYNKGQEVKQGIVHQMFFGEDMRLCVCVKNVCRGELGVNVFLTKKEAEAQLPQPPKGE